MRVTRRGDEIAISLNGRNLTTVKDHSLTGTRVGMLGGSWDRDARTLNQATNNWVSDLRWRRFGVYPVGTGPG